MFKRLFFYFFIIFILFITNTYAIPFGSLGGTGIGSIGQGNGYFDNELEFFELTTTRNIYTITEDDSIWIVDPIGYPLGQNSAYKIVNKGSISKLYHAIVASDGFLYYVDSQGIKKKKTRASTVTVFANSTSIDGDNILIATIENTRVLRIQQIGNYIYYMHGGNGIVYRFSIDDMIVQTYLNIGVTYVDINIDWTVYLYNNELYFIHGHCPTSTTTKMYWSKINSLNNFLFGPIDSYCNRGTTFTSKNYFYTNIYGITSTTIEKHKSNRTNTGRSITIPTTTLVVTRAHYADLGSKTSILLYGDTANSQYNILDILYLGDEVISELYQLNYVYKDIESDYNTYANNQPFSIFYNIVLDELPNNNYYEFLNNYDYYFEILDPDGLLYSKQDIINFQETGIIFKGAKAFNRYSVTHSQTLKNGTWIVKLYEVNVTTQNKGLLDSDSFNVLNYSLNQSISTQPEAGLGLSNPSYLMNSPLIPIMIIMSAFIGIGLYVGGLVGTILGFSTGMIVMTIIGLMPIWGLFLFAIIVFLSFAFFVSQKISGGQGD